MKIDYPNLEKKIKINFKNKSLLIKSLTHKSFDKEENYEKLEFLGDRVLALVMAKKLLEIYPNEKEGILDKKFAALVNKKTCLQIANKLDLYKYVLTFDANNKKKTIEDKFVYYYAPNLCFYNKAPCTNYQIKNLKYKKLFKYKVLYINR